MTKIRSTFSWGRFPDAECEFISCDWRDEIRSAVERSHSLLPYGLGRSYGDSCVNDGGTLLSTRRMNRIISFDGSSGVLCAEAGISLAEILQFAVPRGWFLPVSPGTQFVTLGGAIANDIHGKNHHRGGTFGRHIKRCTLHTSNSVLEISPDNQHADLFRATVGGLGLTGLIATADLQLKRIETPFIDEEQLQFHGLDEFFSISHESGERFDYTVAWLDCVAAEKNFGRGIFIRGNHALQSQVPQALLERESANFAPRPKAVVPINFPDWVLNSSTISLFNAAYFNKQRGALQKRIVPYGPFFYPLDSVLNWNKIYGRRGFFQFQCVVPKDSTGRAIKEILSRTVQSGKASFLAVLKEFGAIESPGVMSFPRAGTTLCLDFANQGPPTLELMRTLETIVREAGGALYPAKDACMLPETFRRSYPRASDFSRFMDAKFSSSFWRRVTQ